MSANISKLFSLGIVVCSAGQINQIENHSVNPGLQTFLLNPDGQVDPNYVAVLKQNPAFSFTTTAIAKALGYAGISGLAIAGSATDLWFQKYAQGGTRATGTNSTKYSISYGMICPRTLEAADGSPATISYDVWARTNDGATSPIAVTAGASMPSITPADQAFTTGPVKINGTVLEGIQRISVNFGLQLKIIGGSGCPFPEFIAIQARQPKITIQSTHVDFATESGMGLYVPQNSTDSLVYLKKIAQGGVRVADATTEHISFSIDDGMVTITEASGDQGGGAINVLIEPTFDGTNAILAVSTATAIS